MKKEQIKCKHCDADIFALECPACGGAYPITEKILEQQPEGEFKKFLYEKFLPLCNNTKFKSDRRFSTVLAEGYADDVIEWLQSSQPAAVSEPTEDEINEAHKIIQIPFEQDHQHPNGKKNY